MVANICSHIYGCIFQKIVAPVLRPGEESFEFLALILSIESDLLRNMIKGKNG
jgi:hypothetical protein